MSGDPMAGAEGDKDAAVVNGLVDDEGASIEAGGGALEAEALADDVFGSGWWDSFSQPNAEWCQKYYDPPWDDVNEDCFVEGTDRDSIGSLCPPPCGRPRVWVTEEEMAAVREDMDLRSWDDQQPSPIEGVLQCAWALLQKNQDVIDWIVCTLSGDPNDGTCIRHLLEQQDVVIKLHKPADPSHAMSVGLGLHLEFNWPDLVPVQLTQINVFYVHPFIQACIGAYRQGDFDNYCGCIALAGALLHELSHVCVRDVGDSLFSRTCPFATMVETSFIWAMTESFTPALGSSCCGTGPWSDPPVGRFWWSTVRQDIDDSCVVYDVAVPGNLGPAKALDEQPILSGT